MRGRGKSLDKKSIVNKEMNDGRYEEKDMAGGRGDWGKGRGKRLEGIDGKEEKKI